MWLIGVVVTGLRAFRRRGGRSTFGSRVGKGSGWVSYIRETQIAGNLQCFLFPEMFAN